MYKAELSGIWSNLVNSLSYPLILRDRAWPTIHAFTFKCWKILCCRRDINMAPSSALPILLQNKADSRLTPYFGL